MKLRILSLLLLCFIALNSFGQNNDGYILFKLQYNDDGLSKEEMAMLPTESEMWFKGDKMKMKMPMGMGMESTVLVMKDQVYLLMNLMGDKMAIKSSKEDMAKMSKSQKENKVKQLLNETKSIAGFECKKAIMSAGNGEEMVVWYTDKIKSSSSWYYQMEGLNGFPLEFSMNTGGMDVRMIAQEVKLDDLKDDMFVVPEGYRIMTQAEMSKMMGGGN